MPGPKISLEEILKDPTGEIAKLRKMGITDFAIITYIVRVHEGQSKKRALDALLHGRDLTEEQSQFVRVALNRFAG